MTPVYHTSRCEITGTSVISDGVTRDVAAKDTSFTLVFTLNIDPSIRTDVGRFYLSFRLIGSSTYEQIWSGWTNLDFPAAPFSNIWVSLTWGSPTDFTNGETGLFLFEPRLLCLFGEVWWGAPDGQSEFAVVEEPHYVCIEPFSWDPDPVGLNV